MIGISLTLVTLYLLTNGEFINIDIYSQSNNTEKETAFSLPTTRKTNKNRLK